jgi:hypothetical protein
MEEGCRSPGAAVALRGADDGCRRGSLRTPRRLGGGKGRWSVYGVRFGDGGAIGIEERCRNGSLPGFGRGSGVRCVGRKGHGLVASGSRRNLGSSGGGEYGMTMRGKPCVSRETRGFQGDRVWSAKWQPEILKGDLGVVGVLAGTGSASDGRTEGVDARPRGNAGEKLPVRSCRRGVSRNGTPASPGEAGTVSSLPPMRLADLAASRQRLLPTTPGGNPPQGSAPERPRRSMHSLGPLVTWPPAVRAQWRSRNPRWAGWRVDNRDAPRDNTGPRGETRGLTPTAARRDPLCARPAPKSRAGPDEQRQD